MKDSWRLTATRTVDLGYEQILILEGTPGTPDQVIFRGDWLGWRADAPSRVTAGDELVARDATVRLVAAVRGATRAAFNEVARKGWLHRLGDALHA